LRPGELLGSHLGAFHLSSHIAIVGTGPTGIYAFKHIVALGAADAVTLFEKSEHAGVGMPYSPETASKAMLANIASIEIPPVTSAYLEWLETLEPDYLRSYGLDPDDLDEREFTPRLLLGQYYRAQFLELVDMARALGMDVSIFENTEITDIARNVTTIVLRNGEGTSLGPFDRVIIATGHTFAGEEEATRSYYPNPWSGLISDDIPAGRIGIMGTSLSALDAAMAIANQHGKFRRKGSELVFVPSDAEGLRITMMSRQGILPEADFYCPIPYLPLVHMTAEALEVARKSENVLDAVFDLFKAEMAEADPVYAENIGLDGLDAESFAPAYFAERLKRDPFHWARKNLDEVERNKREEKTVPWRYAILRMHEAVETLVPDFSEKDRERFDNGLKRVFIDNYGAVPSESIRRLLALRDAGVLNVVALGEDYALDHDDALGLTRIVHGEGRLEFDIFVDARGQKAQTTEHLPFPSLRRDLIADGQDVPEIADDYSLTGPKAATRLIYLAAIPYLMHDKPFCQGITAAAEIAEAVAKSCAEAKSRSEGGTAAPYRIRRYRYA
jgi:uncharacterized NAD(P)/FAD-binding protein YdhS